VLVLVRIALLTAAKDRHRLIRAEAVLRNTMAPDPHNASIAKFTQLMPI